VLIIRQPAYIPLPGERGKSPGLRAKAARVIIAGANVTVWVDFKASRSWQRRLEQLLLCCFCTNNQVATTRINDRKPKYKLLPGRTKSPLGMSISVCFCTYRQLVLTKNKQAAWTSELVYIPRVSLSSCSWSWVSCV